MKFYFSSNDLDCNHSAFMSALFFKERYGITWAEYKKKEKIEYNWDCVHCIDDPYESDIDHTTAPLVADSQETLKQWYLDSCMEC